MKTSPAAPEPMFGKGLGRVKTALGISAPAASVPVLFQAAIAAISGLTPTMFMTHVRLLARTDRAIAGGYLWKRLCEEVRRSHAGLHRAERMLDCLSTLTHGLWICIKALLHGLE